MWLTLALLSAVIFGIASVIMKSATLKNCSDHYILLGLYFSGTLFFFITSGGHVSFQHNYVFYIFATLIAIGSFFGNWAVIKALELGPASLTAPMLNLNLPLFILMSVLFYGEQLSFIKIIIIISILISLVIIKIDPNEHLVIKNPKWFFFVILGSLFLFFREGGLKITMEMGINNTEILMLSYFICLIFSVLNILLYRKIRFNTSQQSKSRLQAENFNFLFKSVAFGLIAGVCSGMGLYLYSRALITGPASLVVLIFSSRIFVIVFFSHILHKERLSFSQKCSLATITLGLSLTSLIK